VTFPAELPAGPWAETHSEAFPADERNQYPHSFHVLGRAATPGGPVSLPSLLPDRF